MNSGHGFDLLGLSLRRGVEPQRMAPTMFGSPTHSSKRLEDYVAPTFSWQVGIFRLEGFYPDRCRTEVRRYTLPSHFKSCRRVQSRPVPTRRSARLDSALQTTSSPPRAPRPPAAFPAVPGEFRKEWLAPRSGLRGAYTGPSRLYRQVRQPGWCNTIFDLPYVPVQAIGVGEKAHLLVERQHVEPFFHNLPDDRGEEIQPPVAAQRKIGQFPAHRTQRLVGVPAGEKGLELYPRMAADHLTQLLDGLLGQAAGGFKWKGLCPQAELKNNPGVARLQGVQIGLIDVGSVNIALPRTA